VGPQATTYSTSSQGSAWNQPQYKLCDRDHIVSAGPSQRGTQPCSAVDQTTLLVGSKLQGCEYMRDPKGRVAFQERYVCAALSTVR
jgi:hypothetical protein